MFTGEKIAQMAAFFTDKQGGEIDILKLIKLLYLADRESVDRYSAPISYDNLVSMEHGPVLSRALNLINGCLSGQNADQWDAWITDRAYHRVSLNREVTRENLDHLSNADIEVLETVWDQFGPMTKWEIRDYTHKELGEWRDPHGSSLPISEFELLRELGRSDEESEVISQDIREQREIDALISSV